MQDKRDNTGLFVIIFFIIVLAGVSIFIILNYNGIVQAEKKVEEAKAQIATVCQRRLDLMPNLIETVKGYAKHEQQTLTNVIAARTNATQALQNFEASGKNESIVQVAATQMGLSKALRGLFALVENYPNLRAASNFMALQDQFEGTENRIAVARQRYNTAVRQYNAKIETFPGVFIAPMFGYKGIEYYDVQDEDAYQAVQAEF